MLAIMEWEPDFVRDAFRDLFSEDRDLEGRIQRFVFYINELFNRYRMRNRRLGFLRTTMRMTTTWSPYI